MKAIASSLARAFAVAGSLCACTQQRAEPSPTAGPPSTVSATATHPTTITPAATNAPSGWCDGDRLQPIDLCVRAAFAHDFEVRRLDTTANMATASAEDAGAWRNPELRLGTSFPASAGTGSSFDTAVRVYVPRLGETDDERTIASARTGEARMLAEVARRELAMRVRYAYVEALFRGRMAAIQEQAVAQESARVAAIERRVAAGGANAIDRTVAVAHRLDAQDELKRLRLAHEEAIAGLRALTGSNSIDLIPPTVGLPTDLADAPQNAARLRRPDLTLAEQSLAEAHGRQGIADREAWPWFTFTEAGWGHRPSGDSYSLRVGIEIPVCNRATGTREAERIRVADAARSISLAGERIDAEVVQAISLLDSARAAQRELDQDATRVLADIEQGIASVKEHGGDAIDVATLEAARLQITRQHEQHALAVVRAEIALHNALGLRRLDRDH